MDRLATALSAEWRSVTGVTTTQGLSDLPSLLAVALAILAYVAGGLYFWARLVSHADTPEEAAFVAGTAVNRVMAMGKSLMIFTWPLWVVIPTLVLAVTDCLATGSDRD